MDYDIISSIENDFSKPVDCSNGTAIPISGWVYHPKERLKKLYLEVGDETYCVKNICMKRYDVYENQKKQGIDKMGYSLHSGFWIVVPFSKRDNDEKLKVRIRVVTNKGKQYVQSKGEILLKANKDKKVMAYNISNLLKYTEPTICICMATYNPTEEQIKMQVNSIKNQSYKNWMCIINDDNSNECCYQNILDAVDDDIRFLIFKNQSNLGFYYNFEECMKKVPSNIDFIALSDQDDYWYENKLELCIKEFDMDTILVYSDMKIVDKLGNIIHDTYWSKRKNNYTDYEWLIMANTITGAASVFRRELLDYVLPFPQKRDSSFHDWFIACTALTIGKIKYLDKPLYDYYQHENNIIGYNTFEYFTINKIKRYFKNIITKKINCEYILGLYYGVCFRILLNTAVILTRCREAPNNRLKTLRSIQRQPVAFFIIQFLIGRVKGRDTVSVDILLALGSFIDKIRKALII